MPDSFMSCRPVFQGELSYEHNNRYQIFWQGPVHEKTAGQKTKTSKAGMGFFGELDLYLFGEGRHYRLYEKMGAHPYTYRKKAGMHFAVWAPHAQSVSVVGDFNGWNPEKIP